MPACPAGGAVCQMRSAQAHVRQTMTRFWEEHSRHATVEEMMLDSSAWTLSQEDKPEIISLLPQVDGKDVLELGAGIGRFTGHLAKLASHVTAVDFMHSFLEKNREVNGHRGNITFLQSDVATLELPSHSFDFVFSNWLFMYLTDGEILQLAERILGWLRPGGYLFFRESCFFQSGDCKRVFNPTLYRAPADYNHLLTSVGHTADTGHSNGFEIVMSRSIQTYIKMKKNQNQLCWLLQKVPRNHLANQGYETFQQFLDNKQYSRHGILRYEKIFGDGFVSTGGLQTTKEFVAMLNLQASQKVIDVGCGIGGGDFYMAKEYGVEVLGVDLSSNMVEIAMERTIQENTSLVQFEIADATRRIFPEASFDVVYSRDTILHIADKVAVFQRFYAWLKPGGKVLITDYCCGEKPWSLVFADYVKQRGYILYTPQEYGKFLEQVGFINVRAEDRTTQFMDVLNIELRRTEDMKEEFIQAFSEEDFVYIVEGWKEKLHRCKLGDQRWGLFYAEKPHEVISAD
ncbi:phosphomethylethanolamine N-methyltransferase-like isoform X2 [Rhinatrema bivittatum]|uniref:phosphomethylethanolamine N-methyltransferase-like isoform X2 n=1 Tax=Rhinatrema bivittatum TaxID=194408 RepID=UPI00112DC1D7|nr:phosphomethylethanolamine N-methyltransferase-like isoform X2 [Rhinatrema bivittatum]